MILNPFTVNYINIKCVRSFPIISAMKANILDLMSILDRHVYVNTATVTTASMKNIKH